MSNQNDYLENTRLCLLKLYHGYNQTHAGYLIAIIIGTLTLISRWEVFFVADNLPITRYAFYFIVIAIFGVVSYFIKRMFYWTALSNFLAKVKEEDIKLEYKKLPYACSLANAAKSRYYDCQKSLLSPTQRIGRWGNDLHVLRIVVIGGYLLLALIFVDSCIWYC